jgi:hypothetical protein
VARTDELERLRNDANIELKEPDRRGTTFTLIQSWQRRAEALGFTSWPSSTPMGVSTGPSSHARAGVVTVRRVESPTLVERFDLDLKAWVGRGEHTITTACVALDLLLPASGSDPQTVDQHDGVRSRSGNILGSHSVLLESTSPRM